MRRGLLLLVATCGVLGCQHAAPVTRPTRPHVSTAGRWTLPLDADDHEAFCVQTWPDDGYSVACTSVDDIRRYVRGRALAE